MPKDIVLEALESALALHAKNHALDHFDWSKSFLCAGDIQELNDLPFLLNKALKEYRTRAAQLTSSSKL